MSKPLSDLDPASDLVANASRRSFLRTMGQASLGAFALPSLTEAHFAWAQAAEAAPQAAPHAAPRVGGRVSGLDWTRIPDDAVLINANENPLGPCKSAINAVSLMGPRGGRYDYAETIKLGQVITSEHSLPPGHLAIYAGSSEPIQFAALGFTSPTRSVVVADPTYEAVITAAATIGSKIHFVPLKDDFSHDLKAMVAADPDAGLIYICNPNNPTGTITSRKDIIWALDNKPKGSVLLVDEAYIHLSDAEPVLDLAAAGKDIIVLRTFSKIYGMAGLRCGYAVGRPDLLEKLKVYGINAMPITGSAAARASLLEAGLVPERKKINADIREDAFAWLAKNGYKYIPSQTNCFMIDCKRPGKQVYAAMAKKNVYIGRTWPVWPNYVRVTVGNPEEMAKFKTAFKEVMDSPAPPAVAAATPFADPFAQAPFPHLS